MITAGKVVEQHPARKATGLRVLVITPALPPVKSGMADFALRLCSELSISGMEVHALTSHLGTPPGACDFHIHSLRREWTWAAMAECHHWIKKLQPDVVNILFTGWMYRDHPMITFVPTLIKRFFPRVRVITHLESLKGIDHKRSSTRTKIERRVISFLAGRHCINYEYGAIVRDSDQVIVLSEYDRQQLPLRIPGIDFEAAVIPPPPIMPILSSVPPSQIRDTRHKLGIADDQILLAYYGYVYPGKGVETLIEALAILQRKFGYYQLIVIGGTPDAYVLSAEKRPDYLNDLKRLCTAHGITDAVQWTGYIGSQSLDASLYLHSSDLCVLPFDNGIRQHNSSFSFCSAHGLPIITTGTLNTEHCFVSGENVILCPPKNAEAIASAIESISIQEKQKLRNRLVNGTLAFATESFNWKSCIEQTINIYSGKQH